MFETYAVAAGIFSVIYMILQSIILIDLCYLAGIKMVKKYDAGESQYGCYLITKTIFAFILAIGLNIFGYIYFHSTP